MRNGFTYNDRHSSEFGVTVRTKSRPIRPSVKSFSLDLPCRDGEYDFSASNPDGREHYSPRIFTMSLSVTANNLTELQSKISALSLWLDGRGGKLIFDDIPFVVWRVKIMDEIIYMPEHGGTKAALEVSFRAKPFGYGIFDTYGPVIGDALPLNSEIPLTLEEMYIYTVRGSAELTVINFGDRPVRPVVKIEGQAGAVILSMNGSALSFTAGGSAEVDFDKQTVTNSLGSVKVSGKFFEFAEGANSLWVTNSNSNILTVIVEFTPEYMYSVDFSENKWGEQNA